jgi:hypothetical protein
MDGSPNATEALAPGLVVESCYQPLFGKGLEQNNFDGVTPFRTRESILVTTRMAGHVWIANVSTKVARGMQQGEVTSRGLPDIMSSLMVMGTIADGHPQPYGAEVDVFGNEPRLINDQSHSLLLALSLID